MKEAPQAINNNGIVPRKQWTNAGATSATKLSLYCEIINMSPPRRSRGIGESKIYIYQLIVWWKKINIPFL